MVEANCSSVCRTVQKNYTKKMDENQDGLNKISELTDQHILYVDEAKQEVCCTKSIFKQKIL